MKTVPISDLRQRVADVIDEVQASDEPMVVLQRARRAAYIVNPDRYGDRGPTIPGGAPETADDKVTG